METLIFKQNTMIKILTTFFLFLLFFSPCQSQSLVGIYLDESNALKETDSLYLNSDSTYRYAFYYPKYGYSEYYAGKWRYVNNQILLDNSRMKEPAFILIPTITNGLLTELHMIAAKLRKKKKGQILKIK